ncbi:YqiA/YcfP family alpha/beta fold hydrolase [Alteromonas oceanisediminis]|uniref:YqiA/YcfP family alpha/beta fold hydrolase n=1 Tax=Alteromonas oceanisediminis TaxID=2836180 RepID=UPI001BDB0816|nr:YqiA/YcfP family alpha/beta fold hydrolase [Alteromonas oceanisediminis]MBT0585353.1 esterase YqiA [Alteromonas oceanisediminis]
MTPIVYLHGFLSSPQSVKAQQAAQYAALHLPDIALITPQIPNTISEAVPFLQRLVQQQVIDQGYVLRCIGSSMGGFLSTWLVEQFGGKAVLINPAVAPYTLMQNYIGEHVNPYTQESFSIDTQHIAQLRALESSKIRDPECFSVFLQTGDEVLDYRRAVKRYEGATLVVEEGGDHSFIKFDRHLKAIFEFLRV